MEVTKKIKHPSWRVYKALQDCDLPISDYGLKEINVYMPYVNNDDLTNELCKILVDPNYVDLTYGINDCLNLFRDKNGRQLIEMLLLENKAVAEISEEMDCAEGFVLTYKSLFFDISVFANKIEKLIYVREGTCGEDAVNKSYLMEKGEEFVKNKLGIRNTKVSVDTIINDALGRSYVAMLKHVEENDLEYQGVAMGWANTIVKLAAQLQKRGNSGMTINDLQILLKSTPIPEKSIDDLR